MRQITATEAARQFSEVLDAVEHARETFVVTRGGRVVASIVPAPTLPGKALKDVLRRYPRDPEWANQIREVRRLLTPQEPPSWPD